MAVKDVFRSISGSGEAGTADKLALPSHAQTRMKRGRKTMISNAPKYRLCRKFEKGETFWYLNQEGALRQQATVKHVGGGGKPGSSGPPRSLGLIVAGFSSGSSLSGAS